MVPTVDNRNNRIIRLVLSRVNHKARLKECKVTMGLALGYYCFKVCSSLKKTAYHVGVTTARVKNALHLARNRLLLISILSQQSF